MAVDKRGGVTFTVAGDGIAPQRPPQMAVPQSRAQLDKFAQDLIKAARTGQAEIVLPQALHALEQNPNHLGLIQGLVEVYTALGNFKGAYEQAQRLVALAPKQPMTRMLLSSCLMKLYRNAEAVDQLLEAEKLAKEDPQVLTYIGHYLEKLDSMEHALRVFKRVDVLDPGQGNTLVRIANVLKYLGKLEEAEDYCNRAIALKEDEYFVYFLRSGLRKMTKESNYTQDLEALLETGIDSKRGRISVQYGLAKEYEDLGEYEKSFSHLKRVSDLQRAQMEYDIALDLKTIDEIKQHFDESYFARVRRGYEAPDAIFIIGMPRTGTTLVERIIGSHSKVRSLGELGIFGRLMVRGVKEMTGAQNVPPADRVRLTAQLDYEQIGRQYIASVADRRGPEPYFIDKLPYNYLNIGPIHAAMPNAKILQLDRHPMDTCYAIYKTLFGSAYPFSYTLEELGQYYSAYRKMMDHWHAVLPKGRILRVAYEDVVEDQEGQTRRIFQHFGLDWEDQVKEFYKNEQSSTTASAAQVRQPVYKTSVAKWRYFEKELAPLRAVLEANGIEGLD